MKPRSKGQLALMRKSGEISAKALKNTINAVKAGISLVELDAIAQETILSLGALPSFKTVPGYKWTTCLTVNSEVVHGTPRSIILKEGDVLGIDLGAVYKGWHTDCAWSVLVSPHVIPESNASRESRKMMDSGSQAVRNDKQRFLRAGEAALWAGVKKAVAGERIGDISEAIQKQIEGGGYSVVRSLVGHGVGRELHEEPEVPGFGVAGTGLELISGMTLAIEPIYTAGLHEVVLDPDGWTIMSKDGSLGGLFEMTVVVGGDKAEVLTDWRRV